MIELNAIPAGGITASNVISTASGGSIDFLNIPSNARRITFVFDSVSTNNVFIPLLRIGAGSITSTGYAAEAVQITTPTILFQTSTVGYPLNAAGSASYAMTGHVTLTHRGSNVWILSGTLGIGSGNTVVCNGAKGLGGVLDRVRLEIGADNFDGGSLIYLIET